MVHKANSWKQPYRGFFVLFLCQALPHWQNKQLILAYSHWKKPKRRAWLFRVACWTLLGGRMCDKFPNTRLGSVTQSAAVSLLESREYLLINAINNSSALLWHSLYCVSLGWSPWYNPTGWLGVKHQLACLPSLGWVCRSHWNIVSNSKRVLNVQGLKRCGRLQLNTHAPYVCGFAWRDMVHSCMVYTERAEMAAASSGTSHVSAVSTPFRWIFKNAL